jgi:hypothetical protein
VDLLLRHTGCGYVIRQDARGHIENELAVSLGAGTGGSHPEYDGIGSSTVHERWHGGGCSTRMDGLLECKPQGKKPRVAERCAE